MKYYSEETVKGLLEQLDSHFVKYLENLPCIEIKEPHGRCVDADKMFSMLKNACCTDSLADTIARDILEGLIKNAPTIIEAST